MIAPPSLSGTQGLPLALTLITLQPFPVFADRAGSLNDVSLQDAVYKMTALPAAILGLRDRGTLEPGKAADITVFDYGSVCDQCTFRNSWSPLR